MLIQKHQSSWASDFNRIAKVIKVGLKDIKINIEHVGSTAIKGLAAKPIIDMDLVYATDISFTTIKEGLEKLDYYHNGDQGIKGREAFKRSESETNHAVLDSIKHHLYVCRVDNEELQRHLAFRDYLIANEKERKAYAELKYNIAAKTNQNQKEYAQLKEVMASEFVASILQKAKKESK